MASNLLAMVSKLLVTSDGLQATRAASNLRDASKLLGMARDLAPTHLTKHNVQTPRQKPVLNDELKSF